MIDEIAGDHVWLCESGDNFHNHILELLPCSTDTIQQADSIFCLGKFVLYEFPESELNER